METKFKVGDMVKITGRIKEGEGPGWNETMTKLVNTIATIKCIDESTGYIDLDTNGWTWIARVLEPVMVLETKKLMKGGVKCRQIVGFRGFPKFDGLNSAYTGNDVWFGLYDHDGTGIGKHDINEKGNPTWVCTGSGDGGPLELKMKIPYGAAPIVDVGVYTLCVVQNSVFTEEAFQNLVVWMKRAKFAYYELRDTEDWSGVEEIVI